MFVSKAVQFKPNREEAIVHTPLLVAERSSFFWNPRTQGLKQTLDLHGWASYASH